MVASHQTTVHRLTVRQALARYINYKRALGQPVNDVLSRGTAHILPRRIVLTAGAYRRRMSSSTISMMSSPRSAATANTASTRGSCSMGCAPSSWQSWTRSCRRATSTASSPATRTSTAQSRACTSRRGRRSSCDCIFDRHQNTRTPRGFRLPRSLLKFYALATCLNRRSIIDPVPMERLIRDIETDCRVFAAIAGSSKFGGFNSPTLHGTCVPA